MEAVSDTSPRDLGGRRVVHARDVLRQLVARDLKLKYRNSLLGFAWTLLNPLLHLLVLYFVFQTILDRGMPRYASFLFSGILAYEWFQSSVIQSASSITGNRELVRRPGVPIALLPMVTVLVNLFHFLLALPVLAFFLFIEGARPGGSLAALPLLIVLQFGLTLGLSYLAACANVIFRDTQYVVAILLRLLFFLSPIFYSAASIPERLQPVYRLNPLVSLLEAYRAVLLHGTAPDWSSLWIPLVYGPLLLWGGLRVFTAMRYRFVDDL